MEYQCRICLDEGVRNDFIAPCNCSGTSKWVHRDCLNKWRSAREDRAFTKCNECSFEYKFIDPSTSIDDDHKTCSKKTLFYTLVTRDLFILLLTVVALISICGAIVYGCDEKEHKLIDALGMSRVPVVSWLKLTLTLCIVCL